MIKEARQFDATNYLAGYKDDYDYVVFRHFVAMLGSQIRT